MINYPHLSVLLNEVLHSFEGMSLRVFVDGTLGAAGHSQAILEAHPEIEVFIGIDQDPLALQLGETRLRVWKNKIHLFSGNFEQIGQFLKQLGIVGVDGMLLDLGVSSMQLDIAEKGFSFSQKGPLDMRMNPHSSLRAEEIVNEWSEEEIGRVLREYGEEKQWRLAAGAIVKARAIKPLKTTFDLVEILRPVFSWKKKGVNPLTLIFQGLRICVNRELEVLERVLPEAIAKLSPKGRLAIISFHSLEDRRVKQSFRFAADDKISSSGIGGLFLDKDPVVRLMTRKPILPSEEEIKKNPRSRSAKLRVVEKI